MISDTAATEKMRGKYAALILSFVNGQISAREFESAYLTSFKNDNETVRGAAFNTLDSLFADVDDYVADPELRKRAGGLDDEELRARAAKAYRQLYQTENIPLGYPQTPASVSSASNTEIADAVVAPSPRDQIAPNRFLDAERVAIEPARQALYVDGGTLTPGRPQPSPGVVLLGAGLHWPGAVALDTAGAVYVCDSGNNRVLKLDAGAAAPVELALGNLQQPDGVAVDPDGALYISDSMNNRLLKLAAGAPAPVELPLGQLRDPGGLALDGDGALYIADRGTGRVLKLAPGAGEPIELPFGELGWLTDVAVDAAGTVYATDRADARVLKLAAKGERAVALPIIGLSNPQGVAVDAAGGVYVTDGAENDRLLKLTGQGELSYIPGFGDPVGVAIDAGGALYVTDVLPVNGQGTGGRLIRLAADTVSYPIELPFSGLDHPGDVAVDVDGAVYVADTGNNRILQLSADRSQAEVLPFAGLDRPSGVAVDADRAVYVADTGNNRILQLSADRSQAEVLPFAGLDRPLGVAVGADGAVYVADAGNNRVLQLSADRSRAEVVDRVTELDNPMAVSVDATGSARVAITADNGIFCLGPTIKLEDYFPQVNRARGILVHSDGDIYVADTGNNRVLKLAARGADVAEMPISGLDEPGGIAMDDAGDLYIADSGNNRVVKLATH